MISKNQLLSGVGWHVIGPQVPGGKAPGLDEVARGRQKIKNMAARLRHMDADVERSKREALKKQRRLVRESENKLKKEGQV